MNYKKPTWAVKQITRSSGLVEDLCCHNYGHPNAEWMQKHDPDGERGFGTHGCDGCCNPNMKKAISKAIIARKKQGDDGGCTKDDSPAKELRYCPHCKRETSHVKTILPLMILYECTVCGQEN